MDFLSNLALGFSVALTPFNLMLALAGVVLGTIVGALPGLSATMDSLASTVEQALSISGPSLVHLRI